MKKKGRQDIINIQDHLKNLGLESDGSFVDSIVFARIIQDERREKLDYQAPGLTRTSVLLGTAYADTRVNNVLEKSGLSISRLLENIGIPNFTPPDTPSTPDLNVNIHINVASSISIYAKVFKNRRIIDALGLALGLFKSGEGVLLNRIRHVGGDPKLADEILSDLISRPSKKEQTQRKKKSPDEGEQTVSRIPLIYISYSHKDRHWKDRLLKHMLPYVEKRKLELWYDDLLAPGDDWESIIREIRNKARASILVISPSYLESKYIQETEVPHLISRQKAKNHRLLPLIVEECYWGELEWLRSIQVFPPKGQPLSMQNEDQIDEDLAKFVNKINKLFSKFPESKISFTRDVEEAVPTHSDDPARIDELGRRPFAKVMTMRISEFWAASRTEKGGTSELAIKSSKEKIRESSYSDDANPARTFTVHIHGSWGSGKTSVLNFIRDILTSGELGKKWVVVDFNAWRHQRIYPPWWSLIREVYRQGIGQLKKINYKRSRELREKWFIWRLRADWLPVLVALALILFAIYLIVSVFDFTSGGTPGDFTKPIELSLKIITAFLTTLVGVIAAGRSLLFGSAKAAKMYMELSKDPMRPIILLFKRLLAKIGQPVAIFIDDLDRCNGDYVVDLLEGIQTLFHQANATYVVAADRNWIRSSFEKRYKDFSDTVAEPGRPLGYLFLEKLFQVSASVPRMSDTTRWKYWKRLLEIAGSSDPALLEKASLNAEKEAEKIIGNAETEEALKNVIRNFSGHPLVKQSMRAIAATRITSPSAMKQTEHMLQRYADLLEPNPRAMKRLVNAYGLHQAVNFLEEQDLETGPLVRWTIVELRWPLLADVLTEEPKLVDKIRKPDLDDEEIPDNIKKLCVSEAVQKVIEDLDERAIRSIVGLSVADPSGGRR